MMRSFDKIPSDEVELNELWLRFRNGEGEAFDKIFAKRYKKLFNYAIRFTRDKELIKDCIQDLFLELWAQRERLVEKPYVTVYLIKALRNNLFRKLKVEKRLGDNIDLEPAELDITDGDYAELDWIANEFLHENQQTIQKAIAQLPKRQQEVIFFKYYEGFSNEEIASIMGIERQSVANFVHRSLSSLKKNLIVGIGLISLVIIKVWYIVKVH